MRLSRHLALLMLGATVPVVVAVSIAGVLLAHQERGQVEAALQTAARALADAVDRQFNDIIDALGAAAVSRSLARGDIKDFYDKAKALGAAHDDWSSIALVDVSGKLMFDTAQPLGGEPPTGAPEHAMLEALQTGKPAVSELVSDQRDPGEDILAIALPIFEDAQIHYAICVRYRVAALGKVFDGVYLPAPWIMAVFDRQGTLIASSRNAAQWIGQRGPPAILRGAAGYDEFVTWEPTQGGVKTFAALSWAARPRWSALVGMPADAYWAPVRQTAALAAGGGIAGVALSLVLVVGIGGMISRGITAAARAAAAIPRGETPQFDGPSAITEVRELLDALKDTSALIARRSSERDMANAELEVRARYRETLARMLQIMVDADNVEIVLTALLDLVKAALNAQACVMLSSAPDRRCVVVQAAIGWRAEGSGPISLNPTLAYVLAGTARQSCVRVSGADDFERLLVAQNFRLALLNVVAKSDGPCGLIGCFFTDERQLTDADLFFTRGAAVVIGKRLGEFSVRLLAQTNAQLAAAINSMNAGVTITDVTRADYPVVFINPGYTRLTGYSREEIIGHPCRLLTGQDVNHEDVKRAKIAIAEDRPMTMTINKHRKDGSAFWSEIQLSSIRNDAGSVQFFISVQSDVTARIDAEEKLRQTMKMDALGQLTGGVAHDFNNILTVITGTIEILADGVGDRPKLSAIAKMISEAADRGSELTRRLLAFARKQPLQPRETDINGLILDTVKLLQSSLGAHIEIESKLAPDAWTALVDPSQLATALVNLALNARDAMPAGGKLTLQSGNVGLDDTFVGEQGEFSSTGQVMIAVTDTGSGIPLAIRDKVLEPFFTTKEERKGTGLGLSMVYGFVKQSGGHLKIYSKEGEGTSIKLYLPRADRRASSTDLAPAAPMDAGQETILVVEDDPMVRNYVIAQLRGFGYTTIAAENAAEALAVVHHGANFDLLFTDIIMPGGSDGSELAKEVRRLRPAVKVLFTSGYTDNAMVRQGRLEPGVLLLQKPYRRVDLSRMIRTALGPVA
ncbi:MAG TPA: ATP-binding protein [Xanthobacteraceae bacterium]|nr:ATP-binding protein [Xanthobacteraceae bacterium]